MAGFMKNAMSYLGMSDVAEGEDDFEDDVDTGETSFDSDHSVTPMPSSSASASTPSAPREQSNPFQGVELAASPPSIRSHMRMLRWSVAPFVTAFRWC